MPVPPTNISAATITSQAIPMEIRMPVRMVGAAAGKITRKAVFNWLNSWVCATEIQSLRTFATPNAVLMSMGQIEQMKMTKIADCSESLMINSASGIQARGDIGRNTCMKGLSALCISGDMPMTNPRGMATNAALKYPVNTRNSE